MLNNPQSISETGLGALLISLALANRFGRLNGGDLRGLARALSLAVGNGYRKIASFQTSSLICLDVRMRLANRFLSLTPCAPLLALNTCSMISSRSPSLLTMM